MLEFLIWVSFLTVVFIAKIIAQAKIDSFRSEIPEDPYARELEGIENMVDMTDYQR